MKTADAVFLEATVDLAEQGRLTCSPNPPVGCIIYRSGRVLGRGFHARPGEGHAEVNALANAEEDVSGATVYVSLEPCAFVGRTPACAETLVDAKVERVVVAAQDPHPRVDGAGIAILRQAGIKVDVIQTDSALRCIEGYVSRVTRNRPFVRLKTASSLDGAVALANGESQWITGEAARADVQYWRARSDAIITGIGTVLSDDPQLTVRDKRYAATKPPLRVVLDTQLRTPVDAQVTQPNAPTLVVYDVDKVQSDSVPRYPTGTETLAVPGGPHDLDLVLNQLADRDCNEVLVEAGPGIVGSIVESELWDEWVCYVAPKLMGVQTQSLAELTIGSMAQAVGAKVHEVTRVGEDLRLVMRPDTPNRG